MVVKGMEVFEAVLGEVVLAMVESFGGVFLAVVAMG